MELPDVLIGTHPETGQVSGTLIEGSMEVEIQDLRCSYPLPFGSGYFRRWERGLFLKRRITALQGGANHSDLSTG